MVKLEKITYLREKVSTSGFTEKGLYYLISPKHVLRLEDRVSRVVATAPEGDSYATYKDNVEYLHGVPHVRLNSGNVINPFEKNDSKPVELPQGRGVMIAGSSFNEKSPGVFVAGGLTLSYDSSNLSNELYNIGNGVIVAKGIYPADNALFYLDGKVFRAFPGAIRKMIPFFEDKESQYLVTSERSENQIFKLDGSVYWEPPGGVTGYHYFNGKTYVHIKDYSKSGGVDGLFDLKTKEQVFDLSGLRSRSIDLFLSGNSLCGLNFKEDEYTVSRDLLIHQKGNFRRETLKVPVAVISNCDELLLGENGRTVYRLSAE